MENKPKDIGGLWLKKSKAGKSFMSGSINGQEVVIFKNGFKKEGDKSPDYRVYEGRPNPTQKKSFNKQPTNIKQQPDEDIPF